MVPGARLTKEQCDPHPEPAFHRRYRGIVGSLGYLVNMTHPDLAWSYAELSKYVQNPGKAHMDAAHHVLRYLRATYDQAIVYERTNEMANTIWGWVDSDRIVSRFLLLRLKMWRPVNAGKKPFTFARSFVIFGFTPTEPTRVYEYNVACVAM
jgi:hypothetical protein